MENTIELEPSTIRDIADEIVGFCDYAKNNNPAVYAELTSILRRIGELAETVCDTDLNTVRCAYFICRAIMENDGIA